MSGCDCDESRKLGMGAMVKQTVMIPGSTREADRMIQCAHCERILKYFGTVERSNPKTGRREYWTEML